jgi:hypothetical protein
MPLLAITKTAMFTPSSFVYFGPHVLLKHPRHAITSWKNGIPGMFLLAEGSAGKGTAVSQIIHYGDF